MEETGRIYEALGPRLVRLRQERGLSQQELARALHVTRQAVSNWERGKTVPDVGTLCRLGEILQVDWNGLCGEMAPPPRRRRRFVLPVVMALAVCLTAAGIWGVVHRHQTDTAEADQQENLRLRAVMRSSDGVTVFHGSGLSGGRALAEALEDLDGTGELPVTDELEQAFQETAETCNFQFLPAYADGVFSDPNAVLTWMYRTLSGGPAFTTEDADRWIDTWFAEAVWENSSTEDFPLSEDGSRYVPRSAYAGLWSYELRQLERREDGSVRLTLTVTRREYDRDRNPVRRDLTLDLTAAEGQLCFQSVVWEAE